MSRYSNEKNLKTGRVKVNGILHQQHHPQSLLSNDSAMLWRTYQADAGSLSRALRQYFVVALHFRLLVWGYYSASQAGKLWSLSQKQYTN